MTLLRTARPATPFRLVTAVTALAAALPAASALAGPDWDKDLRIDAGSSIASAQTIEFDGNLSTIAGKLTGFALAGEGEGDFQDVYRFIIDDPATFYITLGGASGSVNFDACMWLFDDQGGAVLANNDADGSTNVPAIGNAANAGVLLTITKPGVYFLAISGFNSQPVDALGSAIFPPIVFEPGVVTSGLKFWQSAWSGPGITGDYVVGVTGGSGFIPAPGALALLGLSGLGMRRRRRA
jgi:MYXO-CTERM domain-containing protein